MLESTRRWAARHPLLIAIGITLVVRLAIAALPLGAIYDVTSYRIVAGLVRHGQDVYTSAASLGRYPYLPLQLWLIAGASWLTGVLPLPFVALVKLPAILADCGITAVVYQSLSRLRNPQVARRGAWLFALNPLSILVTALHGQFDSLPLLCLLLAWYWLTFRPASPRAGAVAGLFLGLGVLDKTWPALFALPLLLALPRLRERAAFALGSALPVAVGVGVYLALFPHALPPMIARVLGYHALAGIWGYTALLALLSGPESRLSIGAGTVGLPLTVLALVAVAVMAHRQRAPTIQALVWSVLAFYSLSAGFGVQYLVWVVPLAILAGDTRWLGRFTRAALCWMLVAYGGMYIVPVLPVLTSSARANQIMLLASLPAWLMALDWATRRRRVPATLRHPGQPRPDSRLGT